MEKHFFAGNNTSKGFFSYFDYVFNSEKANRIYILKGGPGVGKSSFMKKIASKLQAMNYSIEYIHCSSDNESLDGITIPELNISFVDGTAPHTLDPTIPGAADEIINLGSYLDSSRLEKYKSEILQCNKNMSRLYKSAYRFLSCAGLVSEELDSIYDKYTDYEKFSHLCNEVSNKIFADIKIIDSAANGSLRKLFSEAYTADGYINYTESLCKSMASNAIQQPKVDKKVWAVKGVNSKLSSALFNRIATEAVLRGLCTDCFYHPLHPEKLQHITIPDLNLMLISAQSLTNSNYDEIIDLEQFTDTIKSDSDKLEIGNNKMLYDLLIKNALEKLSETKKEHSLLEVYYVNSMDFKGVDNCFDSVFTKLITLL
jgi:hypothetical protein